MQKKTSDCCVDCIQESRPWDYYVEKEIIKYKWRKLVLSPNQNKPCICYSGLKVGWKFSDKEKRLARDYFVQTRISDCNGKIKIEFLSNGDEVKELLRVEQEKNEEEKRKFEAAKSLKEQNERLETLIKHLSELNDKNKFPFPYLSDLTEHEMQRINVIEGETPPSGIFQLYVLRLKDGGIYVGETKIGYPWRIYNHIRGHKAARCTKNNLTYGKDEWDKNLIHELMEIIQPIGKKYQCTHVFEWWLQQEMLKHRISLKGGIAEAGTTGRWEHRCEVCNKIAKENNLPWES